MLNELIQGKTPTDTLFKAMDRVEGAKECLVIFWNEGRQFEVFASEMSVSNANLMIDVAKDIVMNQIRVTNDRPEDDDAENRRQG